jgi:hypothetical protein
MGSIAHGARARFLSLLGDRSALIDRADYASLMTSNGRAGAAFLVLRETTVTAARATVDYP